MEIMGKTLQDMLSTLKASLAQLKENIREIEQDLVVSHFKTKEVSETVNGYWCSTKYRQKIILVAGVWKVETSFL